MKRAQQALMSSRMSNELAELGKALAQIRIVRKMPQAEAATRANLSRNTISRIENGDAGVAIGQLLRYIEVIRPGATLSEVLSKEDNVVRASDRANRPRRARPLSDKELEKYDF